jgi:hypothetical protein
MKHLTVIPRFSRFSKYAGRTKNTSNIALNFPEHSRILYEHRVEVVQLVIRHPRGLPQEQRWWNNSEIFLEARKIK